MKKTTLTTKTVVKNMLLSISAQIFSLAAAFIINFFLPRFIDEYQYSYWQTYVLYIGYVGVFHFGLLDGLVLRYSQYDYKDLDKPRIRSQFQSLLLILFLLSACVSLVFCRVTEGAYQQIAILVSVGIITRNISTYTSYLFQITNRIERYAVLIVLQKVLYALIVIVLLLCGVKEFYWYCIADLCGELTAVLLVVRYNKGLYLGRSIAFLEVLKESWRNISAGSFLLISNLMNSLLVGSARILIQWNWDELLFGKVSLSFSVTNLFFNFITAISVVLFPSLKRFDEEKLPALYEKIRDVMSPLLISALIFYFPLCKAIEMWIPRYAESITYLGIIMPIIIFQLRISLMTNNYFKVYRKEKEMSYINAAALLLALGLFAVSIHFFNNVRMVLYCLVFVIALRYIVSESIIMKTIGKAFVKDLIMECTMAVIFVMSIQWFSLRNAFLVYLLCLILYLIINRKKLRGIVFFLKEAVFKRTQKTP